MKRMITSVSRKAGLPLPDFNKGRTPMKRNIARRTLLILSVATLYMSMAATARAGGSCSLALATGNWAFSNSGTVIGIGPRVAEGGINPGRGRKGAERQVLAKLEWHHYARDIYGSVHGEFRLHRRTEF